MAVSSIPVSISEIHIKNGRIDWNEMFGSKFLECYCHWGLKKAWEYNDQNVVAVTTKGTSSNKSVYNNGVIQKLSTLIDSSNFSKEKQEKYTNSVQSLVYCFTKIIFCGI